MVANFGYHFISKGGFSSADSLIDTWGSLKSETLNQKCSRMILSVHSKASRLAVLGELGRYPLLIPILSRCLSYKLSFQNRMTPTNLLGQVWMEMTEMTRRGQDCWLYRVNKIEKLLKFPGKEQFRLIKPGRRISIILRSKFDAFWLKQINEIKNNKPDNLDHNKLRIYKQFKSSFTREPYLQSVRNRNQRSSLTRLRVSAHQLATELGRRTRPVTPYNQRFCSYCQTDSQPNQTSNSALLPRSGGRFIDSEIHFLLFCERFKDARNCLLSKLALFIPGLKDLSKEQQFLTLMCPTSPQPTKLVNRFIKTMFEKRGKIDAGEVVGQL